MEIGTNFKTAIGYICITIALVSCVTGYILFWIILNLPYDYAININITADDNLLNMTKTVERMQKEQYNNQKEQYNNYTTKIITLPFLNECWENDQLIPCINFTGDEHFCSGNICKTNGGCPTYYEKLEGKTVSDCIKEVEAKK